VRYEKRSAGGFWSFVLFLRRKPALFILAEDMVPSWQSSYNKKRIPP
jgi:hypothetical protein